MLKSALDFMENSQVAREMHGKTPEGQRKQAGTVVFAFPLTADIAKALDIETSTTGLLIAVKPDATMLAKFKSGELTGFSIGGSCTFARIYPMPRRTRYPARSSSTRSAV